MTDHLALTHGIYDEDGNQVVEFDNPSAAFLRGFQCGQLYEAMETGFDTIVMTTLAENALMVMRLAEYCKYDFKGEYIEGKGLDELEWMYIELRAKSPKPSLFNGGVDFSKPLDDNPQDV